MLKKSVVALLVLSFVSFSSVVRAEDVMKDTLNDAVYGALIGGLSGAAVMAFTDEPNDHLDYIPKGAAIGVLVGVLYGLVVHSEALSISEMEKQPGIQLPTIETAKIVDERTQRVEVISLVNVLRYKF
ncbi:MAG: hypothetical protein WA162_08590 [Thermodesulfobacteriota bacterium]